MHNSYVVISKYKRCPHQFTDCLEPRASIDCQHCSLDSVIVLLHSHNIAYSSLLHSAIPRQVAALQHSAGPGLPQCSTLTQPVSALQLCCWRPFLLASAQITLGSEQLQVPWLTTVIAVTGALAYSCQRRCHKPATAETAVIAV